MKNRYLFFLLIVLSLFSYQEILANWQSSLTCTLFSATIFSVMLGILPLGTASFFALVSLIILKIISFKEGFITFAEPVVWLIWASFFVADAVIKTGLGTKLAYLIVTKFGNTALKLSYSLAFVDVLLAPLIPSNTARIGGVLFPVSESLIKSFDLKKTPKMSRYLTSSVYLCTVVTSAIYLTGIASSPLSNRMAEKWGGSLTWLEWFKLSVGPGFICIAAIPYILKKFYRLDETENREIKKYIQSAVSPGPLNKEQKITLLTLIGMIIGWVLEPYTNLPAVVIIFAGLSNLLYCKIIDWKAMMANRTAWDTLIWFGALLKLADLVADTGIFQILSSSLGSSVSHFTPVFAAFIIYSLYYALHYFFASSTAHVSALFTPFFLAMTKVGLEPKLAGYLLGTAGSLFACLTHYGNGSAPLLFSKGYVSVKEWWVSGLICIPLFFALWFAAIFPLYHLIM